MSRALPAAVIPRAPAAPGLRRRDSARFPAGGGLRAAVRPRAGAHRPRVAVLCAALALAAAPVPPAAATGVEVRPSLEPRRLRVGENAIYTVRVRAGLGTRVRVPTELALDNFAVVAGPSTREDVFWGAGGSGRIYVVRWVLQARAAGTARVGALTVEIGGEPLEVPGASAEVVESAEGRSRMPPGAGPPGRRFPGWTPRLPEPSLELRAEVDRRRPWAGEQIAYTLWIYAQAPFREPNLASPPRFPGFWAEEVDLGDPRALAERVWLDGEPGYRLPLLRRVLFPLRAGSLEIEPLELTLEAGGAPFGGFGLLRPRSRRLTLRSNPVAIEVRPLPEAPAEFSGAVGALALEAALEPAAIALGDGATLTIELSGRGNLQGLAPPAPSAPPGLDLLPPEEDGSRRIAGIEMAGRRTWRYALAPGAAGSYRLAPVTLTYFDPAAGEYRRTSTPELVLTVAEPAAAAAAGEPAGAPATDAGPPARAAYAWAAALAALAALALAVRAFRRRRAGAAGLRRWRRELERARGADRPRRAAALLEESWRELLAGHWRLPRELPPASWEEALREAGAEPAAATAVGALAHDLHALRRAPELSAVGALTDDLIARSVRLAALLGQPVPAR